jgi:hypothetical protein
MLKHGKLRRLVLTCFTLGLATAHALMKVSVQSSQNTSVTPFHPDSTSGLEHLLKEVLKVQKAGDGVRAQR